MKRTGADEVKVGHVVRRAYDGKPRGVRWKVVEVIDRKHQGYWGYWYRDLHTISENSGKFCVLRTSDVVVVD